MQKEFIKPLQSGSILHGQSYNYIIEDVLGQGAFGTTYLAKVQMQGALGSLDSNMRVAVKEFFMKEVNGRSGNTVTVGSENGLFVDYKKKFRAEAEHLALLKHPHIINVLEFFEENNTVYYVMEYVEGGSLDDYIRREGHLSEATTRDYICQIGEALRFMHQHNMLHLDLKPANIMRRKDGTLVLIDFGLSKQFDAQGEPESSTTIGGGTPGYAPLEQATYRRGEGLPVTMDVYALGATAFKMLTGQRPPNADVILNDDFPYEAFQSLNVGQPLINIVAHAMQPMRKKRIQTVGEMLAALGNNSSASQESTKVAPSSPATPSVQDEDDTIVKGAQPKTISSSQPTSDTVSTRPVSKASSGKIGKIIALVAVAAVCIGGVILGVLKCGGSGISEGKGDKKNQTSATSKTVSQGVLYGNHYYVDLGLPSGTKWATMNVGASSPSDYGDYFAWGETSPKSSYNWSNLKYCLDCTGEDFSKYVKNSNPTEKKLDVSDDVAFVNWGCSWHMPTMKQVKELKDNCGWSWTSINGCNGYKLVGPNGNSLFMPAAGYRDESGLACANSVGCYWTNLLSLREQWGAYGLELYEDFVDVSCYAPRRFGRSVRPVLAP